MEALPQDDIASNYDSSVAKCDETTRPSGRSSPPPNCVICLDTCQNKSFTDTCLHEFCFNCLLTWSKVKPECPLCKQRFRSIIHNVQPNQQYDEYMVQQQQTEDIMDGIDIDSDISVDVSNTNRRFRYRTTLTFPRRESLLAIQQFLVESYRVLQLPTVTRPRPSPFFRRNVYRHKLWARPLPDLTGRYRDTSPQFYRLNTAQMHRLVPWIHRELNYLLNCNTGHISYVTGKILDLLCEYPITSAQFKDALRCYFGYQTDHFVHELYCFASTPYDLTGYDRHVQYGLENTSQIPAVCALDSDASDSDVVLLESSEPRPGPSSATAPSIRLDDVIPIETVSHSDSDDDNDVMVVSYMKPPHERTPEIVDLINSDSDVVVQETAENGTREKLVKLTLKRTRPAVQTCDDDGDDDSDDDRPAHHKRKRFISGSSSSSTGVWRVQPESRDLSTEYLPSASSSGDSEIPVRKQKKKKYSKKSRSKSKSKKTATGSKSTERSKRSKQKSRSSKDVKSSQKRTEATAVDERAAGQTPATPRPGSGAGVSRESRRLRSVVTVMNRPKRDEDCTVDTADAVAEPHSSVPSYCVSASTSRDYRTPNELPHTQTSSHGYADSEDSDSDDDLPLKLSLDKRAAS